MCGVAHTPAAVTNKTKIHWVAAAQEAHQPIGERDKKRMRRSEDPYLEGTEVCANLWEDIGVLIFRAPRRTFVFYVRVADIDVDTYAVNQPHKVLIHNEQHKKGNYLEACIDWRRNFTPMLFLVDDVWICP